MCLDGIDQDCDGEVDGFALLASEVQISTGAITSESTSLIWTGSEYGVFWSDWRMGDGDIYFARVATDLTVVDEVALTASLSGNAVNPDVSWTGSSYGVFYNRSGPIQYTHIDPVGAVLTAETSIQTGASGHAVMQPRSAWSGSTFGVSWSDLDFMGSVFLHEFTRISTTGTVLSPGDRIIQSIGDLPFYSADLIWTGSEYGSIYYYEYDTTRSIRLARVNAAGSTVSGPYELSPTNLSTIQVSPDWTGSKFGVSWVEEHSGTGHMMLTQLSPTGVIEITPVRLNTRDAERDYGNGKLVWTGTAFAVSWIDEATSQVYLSVAGYCD